MSWSQTRAAPAGDRLRCRAGGERIGVNESGAALCARIPLGLGPVAGLVGEAPEFGDRHLAAAERERLRDRDLALRPLVDATSGLRGGRAHDELARRNDDHAPALRAVLAYSARPRRRAPGVLC